RAQARRCGGVPPAARRFDRLHQARHRTAGRRNPDDRRRAAHQRAGGQARAHRRLHRRRGRPRHPGAALARDAAQRRHPYDPRHARFVLRQHAGLSRAARPLFHDGRQPRQFHRQPRARAGRLRAVREHRRPGRDHLLLDRRGRACLGYMAVAMGRALEPPVHHRAMSRRRKAVADSAPRVDTEGSAASPPAASKPPPVAKPPSPPKAPAAAKAPAAEKPAPNKAAAEKPAVDKPAPNKAAAEKPAVEKPAANKAPAEKPSVEKPAPEKPAADKSAAPAPRPARKRRNAALTRLEATIAYTFTDASLAERALT